MIERFTEHGLDLSFDAVNELLAWKDDPTGPFPKMLSTASTRPTIRTPWRFGTRLIPFTPTLAADMLDWAKPWTKVPRKEVRPGEVFWVPGPDTRRWFLAYALGCNMTVGSFTGPAQVPIHFGHTGTCAPEEIVEVRRPLVERARLRDVKKGSVVIDGVGARAVVLDGGRRPPGTRCVLIEHTVFQWPLDILVEIVEEPSASK